MVTRISTSGVYGSVLANLLGAEARQNEAGAQVATQKKGKDLKAFANQAELLTSMRTVQSRLKVYQDQNAVIADKLATQDAALNQVSAASGAARQAAEALQNAKNAVQNKQGEINNLGQQKIQAGIALENAQKGQKKGARERQRNDAGHRSRGHVARRLARWGYGARRAWAVRAVM